MARCPLLAARGSSFAWLAGAQLPKAAALLVCAAALASGCGSSATGPDALLSQQLRLANVGSRNITGLAVIFPKDQISFGDVAAGGTTQFKTFPHGVYGYSAFRFTDGGREYNQPVTDWVGETPMPGKAFTYSIELTDGPSGARIIKLLGVTQNR